MVRKRNENMKMSLPNILLHVAQTFQALKRLVYCQRMFSGSGIG